MLYIQTLKPKKKKKKKEEKITPSCWHKIEKSINPPIKAQKSMKSEIEKNATWKPPLGSLSLPDVERVEPTTYQSSLPHG